MIVFYPKSTINLTYSFMEQIFTKPGIMEVPKLYIYIKKKTTKKTPRSISGLGENIN